jgi:hypothetical protein
MVNAAGYNSMTNLADRIGGCNFWRFQGFSMNLFWQKKFKDQSNKRKMDKCIYSTNKIHNFTLIKKCKYHSAKILPLKVMAKKPLTFR